MSNPAMNPHQRRFARTVDPDNADLDTWQEAEADVFKQLLAAGIGFGNTVHVVDVLVGWHGKILLTFNCRGNNQGTGKGQSPINLRVERG